MHASPVKYTTSSKRALLSMDQFAAPDPYCRRSQEPLRFILSQEPFHPIQGASQLALSREVVDQVVWDTPCPRSSTWPLDVLIDLLTQSFILNPLLAMNHVRVIMDVLVPRWRVGSSRNAAVHIVSPPLQERWVLNWTFCT